MRDSRKVLLLTYGEPESNRFSDQFWYSLSILNRLTRRVAPFPRPALPLIAWTRSRPRVRARLSAEWRGALDASRCVWLSRVLCAVGRPPDRRTNADLPGFGAVPTAEMIVLRALQME